MERLIKYDDNVVGRYHTARYLFAKKYCKGKTVMDVACGAGNGTKIIAQTAKQVIGIDPYIQKKDNSATMMNGYIETMKTSSCDVLISLETIEHTISIDLSLKMYSLALHNDGLLILSFPNGWGETEYHLHDTDKHLIELVKKYFTIKNIYGQSRRSHLDPVITDMSEIDRYENIILVAEKIPGIINELSYEDKFSLIYAEVLRRQKEKTKTFGFKLRVLPARLRVKLKRIFAT